MTIKEKTVVSIHYTLTNDNGDVIDTSDDGKPLSFISGLGALIPGLEKELMGKSTGAKFNTRIEPAEAYGERRDELVEKVPRDQLGNIPDLKPGIQLQGQADNGQVLTFTVIAMDDQTVTLDSNHPLAGVALNFAVEVVGIREPTSEELDHGHVHD